MFSVYIVIENGEPYPKAYESYENAAADVREKYKGLLETELEECDGYRNLMASDVYLEEDKSSGKTYLYIEKGIHIYIHRLPVTWVD
jgi:hypothetical protein